MPDAVMIALITGGFSLIGTVLGVIASSKVTAYRIQQLEEKVNEHNQIVERVFKLEQKNSVQDNRLGTIEDSIKELKSYHRGG